jgi:hypothetical protein
MTAKEPASDLVTALNDSGADIGDITIEQHPERVVVSFNLLNEDDIELVREIADRHDYKRLTDGVSLFELYRERDAD